MCHHPIKLVTFDCDGVLFDSRMANEAFYNHICEKNGRHPLSDEELNYVHTHTVGEAVTYLFRDHPFLLKDAIEYAKHVDYTPFLRYMQMESSLNETLSFLKSKMSTAILTNRTTTMHAVLKTFNLVETFDMVVTALDVKHPKPNPEGMYKLFNHFRLSPHEVLYIGDSFIDQQVAAATGVFFAAYQNLNLRAHFYLNDLKDIQTLFASPWALNKGAIR